MRLLDERLPVSNRDAQPASPDKLCRCSACLKEFDGSREFDMKTGVHRKCSADLEVVIRSVHEEQVKTVKENYAG